MAADRRGPKSHYWYMYLGSEGKPIYVTDSPTKLAEWCGSTKGSVIVTIWQNEHGMTARSRYKRVPKVSGQKPMSFNTSDCYYIAVSRDKYELPTYVAESLKELADVTGVSENNLMSMMTKFEAGKIKRCRFRKVLKI